MSTFLAMGSALYSKLTGGTALTALLASGSAVYNQRAPDGAAFPYIVFNQQGGGPENVDPNDKRNLVYFVRAYAQNADTAGSIDAQVSALLHHKALSVGGYTNLWTARETDLEAVETPPNEQPIYMMGALYRIRITS